MKALRSHILKKTIILLLGIGFILPFMQPVDAASSNYAFSSWIHTVVKKSHDAALEQKLMQLAKAGGTIDQRIRKASKLLEKRDDQLKLPAKSAQSSQKMYRILLLEWNQYQSGKTMKALPASHKIKPVEKSVRQSFSGAPCGVTKNQVTSTVMFEGRPVISGFIFQNLKGLQLLASSIHIGAP